MYDTHTLATPASTITANGVSYFSVVGSVDIYTHNMCITLTNVAYAPDFKANLISVTALADKGAVVVTNGEHAQVMNRMNNKVWFTVPRIGGVYVLSSQPPHARARITHTHALAGTHTHTDTSSNAGSDAIVVRGNEVVSNNYNAMKQLLIMMHYQYGHLSYTALWKLIKNNCVNDINNKLKNVPASLISELVSLRCDGCLTGKFTRLPMTGKVSYGVTSIMDLWFVDLVGPIEESYSGKRYIQVVMDYKSRRVMVALLSNKHDAIKSIINMIKKAQTQTGKTLKRLHGDGGGENINKELKAFLEGNGAIFTPTTAHTPQHNPVERVNRTMLDMVKCLLHHAGCPSIFWDEATILSAHILDRRISKADNNKTPYEIWNNNKPSIKHMHVFACDVYIHTHKSDRDSKVDATSRKGIFMGYDPNNNSYYRVFDLDNNRFVMTRDVKFFDNDFTNIKRLGTELDNESSSSQSSIEYFSFDDYIPSSVSDGDIERMFNDNNNKNDDSNNSSSGQVDDVARHGGEAAGQVGQDNVDILDEAVAPDEVVAHDEVVPQDDVDEASGSNQQASNNNNNNNNNARKNKVIKDRPAPTRVSTRMTTQPDWFRDIDFNNKRYANVASSDEPSTYKAAVSGSEANKWLLAISEEVQSLEVNKTWQVVDKTRDMNIIGSRWIFKKKKDVNGQVQKYKARLVAKGYDQEYGIDYSETFAPVLKYKTLRVILALSVIFGYQLAQLDVKTAFLNASINEDLYMEVPDGIDADRSSKVLKLLKALYGTKQAPRAWNSNINQLLVSMKFYRCSKDTCIYIRKSTTGRNIIIGIFVDDMIIAYDDRDSKEWYTIKQLLKSKYQISDLGALHHILGMKITRDTHNLYISQHTYINDKLVTYNMNECVTISTPEAALKLAAAQDGDLITEGKQLTKYRGIVGSLIYASISTRPDITHAVNMLSRYMHTPGHTHMLAGKRILRYLKSCSDYGLVYNNNNRVNETTEKLTITGYCDSDWGGDTADSKSTTGYLVMVNNNIISWNTKKQSTVALSSAEAELMALVEVTKEIAWLSMLLTEANYSINLPNTIYVDNQSTIKMSANLSEHDRSKHIRIKYDYIKDEIDNNETRLKWVPSGDQLADIFTKALQGTTFIRLRNKILTKITQAPQSQHESHTH